MGGAAKASGLAFCVVDLYSCGGIMTTSGAENIVIVVIIYEVNMVVVDRVDLLVMRSAIIIARPVNVVHVVVHFVVHVVVIVIMFIVVAITLLVITGSKLAIARLVLYTSNSSVTVGDFFIIVGREFLYS